MAVVAAFYRRGFRLVTFRVAGSRAGGEFLPGVTSVRATPGPDGRDGFLTVTTPDPAVAGKLPVGTVCDVEVEFEATDGGTRSEVYGGFTVTFIRTSADIDGVPVVTVVLAAPPGEPTPTKPPPPPPDPPKR